MSNEVFDLFSSVVGVIRYPRFLSSSRRKSPILTGCDNLAGHGIGFSLPIQRPGNFSYKVHILNSNTSTYCSPSSPSSFSVVNFLEDYQDQLPLQNLYWIGFGAYASSKCISLKFDLYAAIN